MESPETSKRKLNEGDASLPKVDNTPKHHKNVISDEFSLYYLHRESSPNFRAGQDVLEVGWGDSPEPLNMEQKYEINQTCKKKLEIKESPKSSIPCKRRNVRSTFSMPSKSILDVSKYVAEVQELSKNIMKEFNAKKLCENEKTGCEKINNCSVDSFKLSDSKSLENNSYQYKNSSCSSFNKDSNFDNILETFINEEDDWLSQALSTQEVAKTPLKGNFVKSKSENELTLPSSLNYEIKSLTQNHRNFNNNNFRRTSSFDMSKPQSNFVSSAKNVSENINNSNGRVSQYSLQEIERKRLEAKYRKERKEIERKKLEALKKLEMKKFRAVKT